MSAQHIAAAAGWAMLIAAALLAYVWAGYPVLLWLLAMVARRQRAPARTERLPKVSIVIAARNEAEKIAAKLRDCQALDYPRELLEIIVVCDHCTDRTDSVVEELAAE